ncbi:MAG TPA: hypothetical protein VF746_05835 [Longimicrobium sp.]
MPTSRAPLRGLAAAVALVVLAACAEQAPPTSAVSPGDVSARAEDTELPPPDDPYEGEREFAEVAAEVPGYAGHWYEGDTRVVALTDLSQRDLAVRVLDARPQPELGDVEKTGGGTRFVQARYDYRTLRGWRDRAADPVLAVSGAVFLDLGEVENRLVVGIADEGARSGVQRELAAAGVPVDGAVVKVTGGAEAQPLTGVHTPLESGWLITTAAWYRCTSGYNVNPTPFGPVMMTNSHCTPAFWGLDGIQVYQPMPPANLVGPEVSDPVGWPCLPVPWRCRRSDATAIRITPPLTWGNLIARTAGLGSTTWVGSWNVVGNVWYPVVGTVVDKTGWVTGWTVGKITNTCVNVVAPLPAPANRRLMCQDFATYGSGAGDSGAAVYIRIPGTVNVRVGGLHWGRVPGANLAVFSPRGGVLADLGF